MQDRVAHPAAFSLTARPGCGNDGPVESVENETRVSHASHRPLEISPTPRDFHIPTAPRVCRMEKWKTKTRFPTFPRGARDDYNESLLKLQKPRKEGRPLRGLPFPIFMIILY
jgi:hypothetical protein